MTHTREDSSASGAQAPLLQRLRAHRMLSQVPSEELEWLLEHGTLTRAAAGDHIVKKGDLVPGMYVILKGRLSHYADQGGVRRKVMEWGEGDITGHLPYSRMGVATGYTFIDEPIEAVLVPRQDVAAVPMGCPQLTGALVHAMLDRAREFKASDSQMEKLASLGRLAAGMAHELNNPASAAARSARLLTDALAEADAASRALGSAALTAAEQETLERVRSTCLAAPPTNVLTPLERADREESVAEWLMGRGADESFAPTLAETELKLEELDELAAALRGDKLSAALRWVATACTVRGLARDIERASKRVHELVSAVKGFTYMDHGSVPEPVDVAKGLTDTLAVLRAKARARSATLNVEVAPDVPHVQGFGGELNQVWMNLIDNALDAVEEGGRVTVAAERDGPWVVVRVTDDGPGMTPEVKSRIFDPFFTTKTVGAGTGLGLDIVRRLVTRHEGSVDVTSEPGHTEFRVTLPVGELKVR